MELITDQQLITQDRSNAYMLTEIGFLNCTRSKFYKLFGEAWNAFIFKKIN